MICSLNKSWYTYDSLSEEPAIVSNVVKFCKTKHLVRENQYIWIFWFKHQIFNTVFCRVGKMLTGNTSVVCLFQTIDVTQ
jgi:hypothetical protein